MDRSSSSLMQPDKKRSSRSSSSSLNAIPPPLRKQPMRSCRLRATELNAGQVKSGVIPTSGCPDESIESKIISLPKEIMFNILVLLPADVLYSVMRYLCFQWCKIIHEPVFLNAHLLRSSAAGLFIQYRSAPHNAYYVDTGTRDVTVTRLNFQISCNVWATCDGLVLISDRYVRKIPHLADERNRFDRKILYITNPITKLQVSLPPFKWCLLGSYFILARARSTGEYKVVGTYQENGVWYCGIITVGKDLTWRTVDTQDICVDKRRPLIHRPFSTRGYVYWANMGRSNLFTLDVETEVFLEFPVPESSRQGRLIWYKEVGNFLGCMFWCSYSYVFEVLVLADPKTGEWKNLYKFDLNGKRKMISLSLIKKTSPKNLELKPVAWVNNGEVVVFTTYDRASTSYIAYNVETGETYSFDMCEQNRVTPFWCPHVNSLVSFHLPQ
ncbi:hypothetical protein RHGRI_035428 [Rhododendron griersonianum]|uniref:F-box associated beta-propeller type 3 domain-containing protein n=1 Tax=Rhododendron griersonianum TaxID=479676 RepID=A0AAV6I546_9ERIC|nr:hypothetical protein RHGRI_035428 [Rhododendron griersonianum]